jgi:hypothetical protein
VDEYNLNVLLQVFHTEDPENITDNCEFLGQVQIVLKDLEIPKNKSRWWKLGPSKDTYVGEIWLTLQFAVRILLSLRFISKQSKIFLSLILILASLHIHSFIHSFS